MIANLSLWFAAHVIFDDVTTTNGVFKILAPTWSTFNASAAVLTVLAAALLIWRKVSLTITPGIMALAGVGVWALT